MVIKYTLENGFTILINRKPNIHTTTVKLVVKTGMLYETDSQNGISHFLEHMAFKGTETRTAKELINFIEQLGGNTNAYTSEDKTVYYVNLPSEYWKEGCEFLADVSRNSVFPENELEKEREIIIQEYKERNTDPNYTSYLNFIKTGFKGHNASRQVLGTLKNIKSFTSYDLYKYYKKHYIPEKMILAITLPEKCEKEKEIVKYIDSLFGDMEYGTQYIEIYPKIKMKSGKKSIIYKPGIEQSYMLLGIPSIPLNDELRPAFEIFTTILDGGMSTRLFQTLREELGLAYSVYSFNYTNIVTEFFGIGVITEQQNENLVCHKVKKIIESMINNVSDEELIKAKNATKYAFAEALDQTDNTSYDINSLFYLNKMFDAEYELNKLTNVTKEDVYTVIKRLLENKFTVSIVRPEKKEENNV